MKSNDFSVFDIQSAEDFKQKTLENFPGFKRPKPIPVYQRFIWNTWKINPAQSGQEIGKIPFLPFSFFKDYREISGSPPLTKRGF